MHQPEREEEQIRIKSALYGVSRSADGAVLLDWLVQSIEECHEKAEINAVLNPPIALSAMTDAAKLREVYQAFEDAMRPEGLPEHPCGLRLVRQNTRTPA